MSSRVPRMGNFSSRPKKGGKKPFVDSRGRLRVPLPSPAEVKKRAAEKQARLHTMWAWNVVGVIMEKHPRATPAEVIHYLGEKHARIPFALVPGLMAQYVREKAYARKQVARCLARTPKISTRLLAQKLGLNPRWVAVVRDEMLSERVRSRKQKK